MLEVFFDGWCPLCRGVKQRLERLDWLHRLIFRSIREPGATEGLGVAAAELERRMYVRDMRTGRVAGGIWAVAAVAARVPTLMPLWPVVILSAWAGVGGWAYDFVAARRGIVPVGQCEDDTCEIHKQ